MRCLNEAIKLTTLETHKRFVIWTGRLLFEIFCQQKVSPTERLTDGQTEGAPEQQERHTQQVLRERHCSHSHHSPAVHMHTAAQGGINTNGRARAEEVTRVRRDRRTVLGTCLCLHLRACAGIDVPLAASQLPLVVSWGAAHSDCQLNQCWSLGLYFLIIPNKDIKIHV